MVKCPVHNCSNTKSPRHYLCRTCWFKLPTTTRNELWKRDEKAGERVRLLATAIAREMPLAHVLIQENDAGEPVLRLGG